MIIRSLQFDPNQMFHKFDIIGELLQRSVRLNKHGNIEISYIDHEWVPQPQPTKFRLTVVFEGHKDDVFITGSEHAGFVESDGIIHHVFIGYDY